MKYLKQVSVWHQAAVFGVIGLLACALAVVSRGYAIFPTALQPAAITFRQTFMGYADLFEHFSGSLGIAMTMAALIIVMLKAFVSRPGSLHRFTMVKKANAWAARNPMTIDFFLLAIVPAGAAIWICWDWEVSQAVQRAGGGWFSAIQWWQLVADHGGALMHLLAVHWLLQRWNAPALAKIEG